MSSIDQTSEVPPQCEAGDLRRKHPPGLLPTIVGAVLGFLLFDPLPTLATESDAEHKLSAFATGARIDYWPALKGCSYAEAIGDRRAGLWLKVIDSETALSRWDGACRAPATHTIVGWPADLPFGDYVVAVTADTQVNSSFPEGNRRLRIEAVLVPTATDHGQLFRGLMNRVCAGQRRQSTDRGCREVSAVGQEGL